MIYKPDNVKLVITHNGVEQEIIGFDEEMYIEKLPPPKKTIVEVTTKSKRCKDTIDWAEEEYGDEYKKPNKGSQSVKQSISSTLVKHLTKSEIESLRQNKHDAYALMMKMD